MFGSGAKVVTALTAIPAGNHVYTQVIFISIRA